MQNLPLARTDSIVVQSANKELLIYDLRINRAFCLNETSACIYQGCDGKTSFETLKKKFGLTDDLILVALDELHKNNLLEGKKINFPNGLSRREVVKKIGFASLVALPLISSIVAPTAANAQSVTCRPSGVTINGTENFIDATACFSTVGSRCCKTYAGGCQCVNGGVFGPCTYSVVCL